MSLWMVLVVAGHVQATWGPLPYDIEECQKRRPDAIEILKSKQISNDVWTLNCEFHTIRPDLDEKR